VSLRAGPFTDALAEHGLAAARAGLLPWYEGKGEPRAARSSMAYAALLSGLTLANAGLGVVHGLSSPLGAGFPIPHGAACGTLLAAATAANVMALIARDPDGPALARYARVWEILSGATVSPPPHEASVRLTALLADWVERLGVPRLGHYGVRDADVVRLVAEGRAGSTKTNPIALSDEETAAIVRARL
jgi:alcohol dehydrogenase class IV